MAQQPPRATTNFTYGGGPLLCSIQVVTVFWGSAWRDAHAPEAEQVNKFFQDVLTSSLVDQLAEYSVPGKTIGHGALVGTATVTAKAPGRRATDPQVQEAILRWIRSGIVPQPTPNTLYFIYLPPGAVISMGYNSDRAVCGYHRGFGDGIFCAVLAFPDRADCHGGLSDLDALTSNSSHELCEAITDAVPGQGWHDDLYGEIGDVCVWRTKKLGNWTVQLEWSNHAGGCV